MGCDRLYPVVPSPLKQKTPLDCTTIARNAPDESLYHARWVFPRLDDIGRSERLGSLDKRPG